MDTFGWVTSTVGMVMALGMTRLLLSAVYVFKSRKRVELDWVPLVWAASIFYSMLDFSWDLHMPAQTSIEWTFVRCLILFAFSLILFAAAAMILPNAELPAGSSMRVEFEQDGRWGLILISVFDLLCVVANWFYWRELPVSLEGVVNIVLSLLALIALKASSRRLVECSVTLLYATIIFGSAFIIN